MIFALPLVLTFCMAGFFLVLERVRPGRALPNAPGWYGRAITINFCQLAISIATNGLWFRLLAGASMFKLTELNSPVIEGFIGWFVGTFAFYWWHRLRHAPGFWQVFHQIHHSPTRIEALTAFYKHPIEIFADAAFAAIILYPMLGCSISGAMWFNFFAASGEFVYHSNFKSPRWLKYFIQSPELHSVHHERDVHTYNFSDLPIWDRLFGTYRDTDHFVADCGFPRSNERKLGRMLLLNDVYQE